MCEIATEVLRYRKISFAPVQCLSANQNLTGVRQTVLTFFLSPLRIVQISVPTFRLQVQSVTKKKLKSLRGNVFIGVSLAHPTSRVFSQPWRFSFQNGFLDIRYNCARVTWCSSDKPVAKKNIYFIIYIFFSVKLRMKFAKYQTTQH